MRDNVHEELDLGMEYEHLDVGTACIPFERTIVELAPPLEFEEAMQEAMVAIDQVVKNAFGADAWLLPFGSIVQGSHLDGSDLDLGVSIPGEDGGNNNAERGGKTNNSGQVAILKRLMSKFPNSFRVIETRFWKHIKVPIIVEGFMSSSGKEVETDVSVGVEFENVAKKLHRSTHS